MLKDEMKQKNISLLLPDTCGKYVLAIMKHFELNEITFIKKDSYFKANDLLLPSYTVGSGHIHPDFVKEVRESLLKKIPSAVVKERIFVSRSRQKARLLHNQKEVIDVLKPLGFEIIYFEDHTFEEQVRLVRNAKILVTSHGANLTNCMFMPDNSKVLEIIRDDKPNFCYWALASVTNKKYYYFFSEVTGNDHLVVDIEQFKIHLQKVLND
jgi:capsular polysaccharide biosynthesis protein